MITETQLPNKNIIAIDGTSGSGKSSIAKALAKKLDLKYLETGSIYRGITLLTLRNNIDVHNEEEILTLFDNFDFHFDSQPILNDENISSAIKEQNVVLNVSHVSLHPQVRENITQIIRQWIIDNGGGVVEGRDITTVVAPLAKVKCYVDADPEIRAKRRQSDPKDNIFNKSEEEIKHSILLRDKIDSSRKAAPLKKAEGVIEIDTSTLPLEENVNKIVKKFKEG